MNTQYNLDQHEKGKHGWGVKAYCGQCLDWKSQIKWHIKKCKKCQKNCKICTFQMNNLTLFFSKIKINIHSFMCKSLFELLTLDQH